MKQPKPWIELSGVIFCPHCRKSTTKFPKWEEAKFCPFCGKSVKTDKVWNQIYEEEYKPC